jgi:hypothetical protein
MQAEEVFGDLLEESRPEKMSWKVVLLLAWTAQTCLY